MWARCLKTLKDLGIAENTLVVWMSDNGPMYDVLPRGLVHRASWRQGRRARGRRARTRSGLVAGRHRAESDQRGDAACHRHVHDRGEDRWCAGSSAQGIESSTVSSRAAT